MSRLDAEQEEAFRALVVKGRSREELAAKFGISVSSVRARINRMGPAALPPRPAADLGPVKLTNASAFQCRFCVEPEAALPHAELLVCGQRVIAGKSWCPEHARIVWPRVGSKHIDCIEAGATAWAPNHPDLQQ